MTRRQNTPTAEQVLAGVPLFAHLPKQELRRIAARCQRSRARKNQHIIDLKSTTHDVFFIVRGRVRIVNFSLSGREVSFEDIGPGSYFGELAAIDRKPRSAGAIALDDVLLMRLGSHEFIRAVTSDQDAALALMKRLALVVRQANQRIMDLSTLAANNRVYAELLRLATAGVQDDGSAIIQPIPLHADIASRVSTTRETVVRVLSILARSGLVRRRQRALVIHDMKRLAEMVDEFRGE